MAVAGIPADRPGRPAWSAAGVKLCWLGGPEAEPSSEGISRSSLSLAKSTVSSLQRALLANSISYWLMCILVVELMLNLLLEYSNIR